MSHAYRQLIPVECTDDEQQLPAAFTWRGERYHVLEVWGHWRLETRWWEEPTDSPFKGQTQRRYYRVRAQVPGHQYDMIAELYHDRAQGCWVLDRVLD
jgi:Family of unknown function (DUF6504)